MALHLLDTNAVIDYLKGFAPSVQLIQDLHNRRENLGICAVVVAEVYSGIRPNEHPTVDAFLDALTFLPTSPQAAKQAGEWRFTYARQGIQLSTSDTLIAATANEHKATVVTGNVSHFPTVRILQLPKRR